jgi:two-component system, NtrC family, nitrogen regulation response regulator NtrX
MGKPSRARLEEPANEVEGDLLIHSPAMRAVAEAVRLAAGRRTPTLREARAEFEREWIAATLAMHQGRVGDAARALGIQRTNLYRKVRQLKVPLR